MAVVQGRSGPPDILDPGPLGDYPYIPRHPDGTLDTDRVPTTPYTATINGRSVVIDPTPTVTDGRRVDQVPPPAGWPNPTTWENVA